MLVRFLLRNFCLLGFVVTAFSQEVSIFSVKPYSWSQNVSGVVIAQRIVQDRTQYYQLRLLNGKPAQLSKDNIVRDLTLPVTNYNPLTFSSLNDREMESLESLLSQTPESTEKNILIKALNGVRERKLAAASAANEVKKPTGSMDGAKNMGPIVSKTGKTYSDIESWSLDKGSLKISHRDGVARIPIDEVLEQDYQKFGITPEKLEQLESELTEIKVQRQAVEQEKLDAQKNAANEAQQEERRRLAELERQQTEQSKKTESKILGNYLAIQPIREGKSTTNEIQNVLLGKTADEVKGILGVPNTVRTVGSVQTWDYNIKSIDSISGVKMKSFTLLFWHNNIVDTISFN